MDRLSSIGTGPFFDALAERLPAHEGHRKERQPAHRLTGGEHGYDVRFLERRGELDFPGESRGRESVGELRWQHFDDDIAAEGFVAGDEHAGHPARAQLGLHRVAAAERLLELVEQRVQRTGSLAGARLMYGGKASHAPMALASINLLRRFWPDPSFEWTVISRRCVSGYQLVPLETTGRLTTYN